MKEFAVALLLAVLPLGASACSEARSEGAAADAHVGAVTAGNVAPAGPLQTIALLVPDMSCALCARPIEKNLRAMGVRGVKADLDSKWVTGRFDPEQLMPEQIRTRVEELKFRVAEMRVE